MSFIFILSMYFLMLIYPSNYFLQICFLVSSNMNEQICCVEVLDRSSICRIRTGFRMFWKVLEIDNAIFQNLESFEKWRFFRMAMEKLCIVTWENSKILQKGYNFVSY